MSIFQLDYNNVPANPFSLYDKLHKQHLAYVNTVDKSWGVFKYDEVKHVLTNHHDFSAIAVGDILNPDWLNEKCYRSKFITMEDPPDCDKNRKLINKLFVKNKINSLIPTMRKTAFTLLDSFPEATSHNFIEHFSYPYTATILNKLFRINFDFSEIQQWINAIESLTANEPEEKNKIENKIIKQRKLFLSLIEERRISPTEDFISHLIQEHGDNLSNDDLLNIIELLISAGYHTVIHSLSQAVLLLAKNKKILNTLKISPKHTPQFVEELLRFYPSVHYTLRRANKDVHMTGYTIPKGANVKAIIAAANRDPDIFVNPNDFDISRANSNDHLTFGVGPHVCLGSGLARLEMSIAVEAITSTFSHIESSDSTIEKVKIPTLLGYKDLNISIKHYA